MAIPSRRKSRFGSDMKSDALKEVGRDKRLRVVARVCVLPDQGSIALGMTPTEQKMLACVLPATGIYESYGLSPAHWGRIIVRS